MDKGLNNCIKILIVDSLALFSSKLKIINALIALYLFRKHNCAEEKAAYSQRLSPRLAMQNKNMKYYKKNK